MKLSEINNRQDCNHQVWTIHINKIYKLIVSRLNLYTNIQIKVSEIIYTHTLQDINNFLDDQMYPAILDQINETK